MKASVYSIEGVKKESIELPSIFETPYNPVLINRAVLSIQSMRKQPKGANPRAGKNNTAIYVGTRDAPTMMRTINIEKARLPRLKNRRYLVSGRVAKVPQAVGGMAAHPPKAWKKYWENINKKEKRLALKSAIAATINKELVNKRFVFDGELPIIIEDKLEEISRTKELVNVFKKLKLIKDIENAKKKTRERAGKGKRRGRRLKVKKSLLIVTSKNNPVLKAARNIPGVDAVTVNSLNTELLAPGGEAGRLVVWTISAIRALEKKNLQKVVKGNVKKEKVVGAWRKDKRLKRKAKEKAHSEENKELEEAGVLNG